MRKSHATQTQQHVFGHHAGKLGIEHRGNKGDGHMIFFQHPGAFGCGTDSALTAGADACAAADALFHDADGLFIFKADGLGGADPQA